MIYRRVNLLGVGDKFIATKKRTLDILARKLPLAGKVISVANRLYYHSIMLLAIVVYLVMLAWMAHSVMNDISQLIVLVMLAIYMSKDIKVMISYWPVLVIY